jgi:hypothetical protein
MAAGTHAVRLALAEQAFQSGTEEGIVRAAALAPQNARYWRELAARGRGGQAALAQALTLNPRDAQAWIEAALQDELAGDHTSAEGKLLEAARWDRTWKPRWTLANFYFRRADPARFWEWARRSAELGREDLTPLVNLCWQMDPNPHRLLAILPERPGPLAQALAFSFRRAEPQRCRRLAERLLAAATPAELPTLLEYCDRLVFAAPDCIDCLPAALGLWGSLAQRGLIPHLDPRPPDLSVNPALAAPLHGRGFDWRISHLEGVETTYQSGTFVLRVSGRQPESCELVLRYSPIAPGRPHELRYRYAGRGPAQRSGLFWRVTDAASAQVLAVSADLAPREEVLEEHLAFTPPSSARLVKLALAHERRPGAVRAEAEIAWHSVHLWTAGE